MKTIIRNEDCRITLNYMKEKGIKIDYVLTSPPYNISKGGSKNKSSFNSRNDMYTHYNDRKNWDEYGKMLYSIFKGCLEVLNDNGVFIINMSYANTNVNVTASDMLRTILKVADKLDMKIADIITWKKTSVLPNNGSNKCTRICEYIFILVRAKEFVTFKANKNVKSVNKKNKTQCYYDSIFNFVEAKNNDGKNPYNNATYSTELVQKLLSMYVKDNNVVYDPFGGTGTTSNGCILENRNITSIMSELDIEQCKYAYNRIKKE